MDRQSETDRIVHDDTDLELYEWPDALIQAVAAAAPELIRDPNGPSACPDDRMTRYAAQLALVTLEVEDLSYVDLEGYAAELRTDGRRRFDVDGITYWVTDANAHLPREEDPELPTDCRALSVSDWPDVLVAAVGAQAPHLLRTVHGQSWAIAEADFPKFALVHQFEGWCDAQLFRYMDTERYARDLRQTFVSVVDADGGQWWVRADETDLAGEAAPADTESGVRWLAGIATGWPDALVAAVAAQLPKVFQTDTDYEAIQAVRDDGLHEELTCWAEGFEQEVAAAGGIEAWIAQLVARDFRAFDADGYRFWVYLDPDRFRPDGAGARRC